MSKAYLAVGIGIVLLGLVHMSATFAFYDGLNPSAIWFFSAGIALLLLGLLNLLNWAYGRSAKGLKAAAVSSNVLMTAFAAVAGSVTGATALEFLAVVGLHAGAVVLSATNRAARWPAEQADAASG